MTFLVAISYVIVIIVQILSMKEQKSKKELIIALIMTIIAIAYTYNYLMGWNLPTIESVLISMFDPLAHKIFGGGHVH